MFKSKRKSKQSKELKLYDNCNKLSVKRWIEILQTNNYHLLIKKGTVKDPQILLDVWEKINEEFSQLRNENDTIKQYDKIQYREIINLKLFFGTALINRIIERMDDQLIFKDTFEGLIAELSSWGFRMNKDKPIIDEIEKVKSELESFQTSYEILTEELFPEKKEEEEIDAKEKNVVKSIYQAILLYKSILKIEIDINKTSLYELAIIEQQAKDMIEQSKNHV